MNRLDDKTTISLQWVIVGTWVGGCATLVGVIAACFWVFTVDARLSRIEQKLGIEERVVSDSFVQEAKADAR